MKQLRVVLKSGAEVLTPYSSKFYGALTDNIGKDHVCEHPSAVINSKEVQAVVFERDDLEPAVKMLHLTFKSGAHIVAPYSSKFYTELTANLGKDHVCEHPSAAVNTKDLQAVVFERVEKEVKAEEA